MKFKKDYLINFCQIVKLYYFYMLLISASTFDMLSQTCMLRDSYKEQLERIKPKTLYNGIYKPLNRDQETLFESFDR